MRPEASTLTIELAKALKRFAMGDMLSVNQKNVQEE